MPTPNGFLLLNVLECVLICPLHFRVNQVLVVLVITSHSKIGSGPEMVPIILYHIFWIYPKNLYSASVLILCIYTYILR